MKPGDTCSGRAEIEIAFVHLLERRRTQCLHDGQELFLGRGSHEIHQQRIAQAPADGRRTQEKRVAAEIRKYPELRPIVFIDAWKYVGLGLDDQFRGVDDRKPEVLLRFFRPLSAALESICLVSDAKEKIAKRSRKLLVIPQVFEEIAIAKFIPAQGVFYDGYIVRKIIQIELHRSGRVFFH